MFARMPLVPAAERRPGLGGERARALGLAVGVFLPFELAERELVGGGGVVLSIGTLSVEQTGYYELKVARGVEDYYSGEGEAPGRWRGSAARALGLEGVVRAEQFAALQRGLDPRTGEVLVERTARSTVASHDLTFSAPKSISVLFAVGDRELSGALVDAHEDAVDAALSYLERVACEVRRGRNGVRREHADGFVVAAYRHRMSRAKDPQLHTHCVTANMAKGLDRRWTALHAKPIFDHAKSAGYVYQAHLRHAVRERLSWARWREVVNGMAELEQIPDGVLAEFSQRRAQIIERERKLEAAGVSIDHAGRERIAYDTRERKQDGIDAGDWRDRVRARAGEHGLGAGELAALLAAPAAVDREPLESIVGDVWERLAGPRGLTARRNSFRERDAVIAIAQAAGQGAPASVVRGAAAALLCSEELVELDPGVGEYTTRELLAQEDAIVRTAERRRGDGCAILDHRQVHNALRGLPLTLGEEQLATVLGVTSSGHGMESIEALAGTGKTTTAGAIREVYERAGYRVLGAALTGRAVRELKEQAAVSKALTLDGWLVKLQADPMAFAYSRSVLLLDEAGMPGTRVAAPVLNAAARAGVKVVVMGDSGQLSSVTAGGWLASLTRRLGSYELRQVIRQRDPRERRLLAHLHRGQPDSYLQHKLAAGELHLSSGSRRGELAEAAAIAAWLDAVQTHGVEQAVLISRNNDRRARLNVRAQHALAQAGVLGTEVRAGGHQFRVGERVIARQNARAFDVDNGTRGTVVDGDQQRGLWIRTDAGEVRELPPSYVAEHVELAYCLTGHGMQGGTVDWAAVIGQPGEFTRNWSYTACSRAREPTHLFVIDDATTSELDRAEIAPPTARGNDPLARLARRMRERDDEDLALDRLHRIADEPPAAPGRPVEPARATEHAAAGAPGDVMQRGQQSREQLADLDARARERSPIEAERLQLIRSELERQRELHRDTRERAKAPAAKSRWARRRQPAQERERARQLAHSLAEEVELLETQQHEIATRLSDPDTPRTDRARRVQIIRELEDLRERHLEQALENPEPYLLDTLGERPEAQLDRHAWDRGAKAIETYRFDHSITDTTDTLGAEPARGRERYEFERVFDAVNDARVQLRLGPLDPGDERGIDRRSRPTDDRGIDI